MFFRHVPCFLRCFLLYFSFFRLHAYAFAIHSVVHCGSTFEPGAVRLPYYCTSICVRSWCTGLASCVDSKQKQKNHTKLIYARTRILCVYVPYMACISARRVYLPSLIWFKLLLLLETVVWNPWLRVYVFKSMWIWVDMFSAGIESGTLRITKFLQCRALHRWAMVTDESPKILWDPPS